MTVAPGSDVRVRQRTAGWKQSGAPRLHVHAMEDHLAFLTTKMIQHLRSEQIDATNVIPIRPVKNALTSKRRQRPHKVRPKRRLLE